ncbi:MAG: glycosyltransferase [Algoriphagus sp.]|uniref:glycosyltransferase n=1 Tax=Algoriphagus sp. TaxID=1872435 RepID=UPI0026049081|nr:glycosyltransferase [Algoriphagus sp.]MDG1275667.1 glycosyltransferase [Algoriphagus sp.]
MTDPIAKNKIKVLHLIKSLGRGGAEKLIPETALVHDQNRFEFHCLYFYHQENNIVDEFERAGIQVHLFPSGNLGLFLQVRKVREFVQAHKFDLIHAHLPWAGILARSVGNTLKTPIVYTEHNTWDRYNKVSYWGNRVSFKKQDVVIAVSNEVALSMRLNSIWSPYARGGRMKLKVIQNGVNTEIFRRIENERLESERIENEKIENGHDSYRESPTTAIGAPNLQVSSSLKSQLGIPEEAKVIGKVAVFRSQKRLWLWVEIALEILKTCPEAHFVLVGDGEWRERILKQIQDSGKSSNFHWVGVQKNVIPYLSIMDIYLSSSEFEGLPIAMLEAMSCEIAVVATRAGGIGEVITQGNEGFLTAIEDWSELANYCIQLIQNPEELKAMKLAARDRVIKEFSMKKMVAELEKVYQDLVPR